MTLTRAIIAVVFAGVSTGVLAQVHEVPLEFWDRPRTATRVLEQENVKRAVHAALAQPESRLVIHHGNSQEGLLHAEELRSWLGALAVDTRRIVLRSDQPAGTPLRIEVSL
jgi:hypothetical protein